MRLTEEQIEARNKLNNAFEYLRPRMAVSWQGDIGTVNPEGSAGSIIARAICSVVTGNETR
jgi:hypothetical protein